jgi:hypothetical protein
MAFANITEARARVIDPTQEHSSSILYGSDKFFTMGTTFYTNASKSVLASAGNYVIPTNYKSYYVTLGSNGRMTTEPLEVMTGSMDTSWVDDTIHSGGVKIANYPWSYINGGGTAMVLDTASLLLTDTIWYTQAPEAGTYKAWQVDMGIYRSSSLENIDLSDMKGYEIKITCGNWQNSGRLWRGQPGVPGFQERTQTSAIVHIAADPNRVVTTGSITYTFRPDYFIPSYNYEYSSFFRRLPDTLPIIDNSGSKKEFLDMGTPLGDLMYKSTGLGSLNRVRRVSTRRNKCVTTLVKAGFAQYPYGAEYDETFANPADRLQFDNDFFIRGAVGHIIGRDPDLRESDTQKCAAMMESLVVDNDTWANGYSIHGVKYSTINPYHWTWELGSGTNGGAYSPANNLLGCYQQDGNSRIREFDFEYFSGAGGESYLCGLGFKKCIDACKVYAQANNYFAYTNANGFLPTFSNYAGGIYAPGWYGGWDDSNNASLNQSLAQLRNGTLYYDYNNYYTSQSVDYTALGARVTQFYVGAGDAINRHYITNYQNFGKDTWRAYQLVHSYDITKKLLFDIFGATVAGNARAMGYFWQYQEPIDASDFGYERIYTDWSGANNGEYRPQPAPSTIQSQAVWSMAYADGSWCWESYVQGEEPESINWWQNYLGYNGEFENQVWYKVQGAYGETRSRSNGSWDWLYIGYWQALQHKDIIAAPTIWKKAETYWNSVWTTGERNYPVFLFYLRAPIVTYKLSADGTEALMLVISPFNNGYTKETHRVRLPTKDNREFLVDTWGNYTSVIRIKNL